MQRARVAVGPDGRGSVGSVPGAARQATGWAGRYLIGSLAVDGCAALAAGLLALRGRFDGHGHLAPAYLFLTLTLPVVWVVSVALAGGYEARFFGAGADEFRRIINAGLGLTSAIAILSYATKAQVSRGYVLIAMPCAVGLDLVCRYCLRKRLHRVRAQGACMRRAVAVGYRSDVAHLASELRREPYHGLAVVAVCLAGQEQPPRDEVLGIPVYGGLEDVVAVVRRSGADTVAVLACPEMNAARVRRLAWDLEKTGTDLCLAPALLDVAGPRTTVRAAAGLPLLYVDHPDLSGTRQVIKGLFDKVAALSALIILAPLLVVIAAVIRGADGAPALFTQIRVGKDGRLFRLYKFRTMVADAEQRKGRLSPHNEGSGVLFKIRNDPRVTPAGAWLRRWSLDELPQLINVLLGQMSLVGPRPALPQEAASYGEYVRRRLAVRPGMTGLWQIHGRSDLPWEEAVRLDLRYVENWSLALDLLILWKTWPALARGEGAY